MNKFRLFLVTGLALSLSLASCKKDDATVTPTTTPAVAPKEYSVVLLAPPAADNTSKTFFAADSGTTFTYGEATTAAIQSRLIFGYYYLPGLTNPVIASIDDYPAAVKDLSSWGTNRKSVTFKTSAVSYDNITRVGQIDTAFTGGTAIAAVGTGTAGKRIGGLTVGATTYVFQVAGGKSGVLKVTALTPGDGSTGSITLAVKYQK